MPHSNCLSGNRYFPAKSELIYHFMPMKRQYSKHNDIVHKFATEVIEKRRKQFESQGTVPPAAGKKKYLDFIDILLAVKVHETHHIISCDCSTFVCTKG